jgi:hypothetical protein
MGSREKPFQWRGSVKDLFDLLTTAQGIGNFFDFFIPGFIALVISGAIGPTPDGDFAKRATSAIGYSAINFAVMSSCVRLLQHLGAPDALVQSTRALFIFVLPVFYPYVVYRMREQQRFGFSTPFPSSWDQFFARRNKKYYVRATLKGDNAEYVLGYYGSNSISSQAPAEQILLLERIYDEDPAGNWVERQDTVGLLLPMSECRMLEFIIPGERK